MAEVAYPKGFLKRLRHQYRVTFGGEMFNVAPMSLNDWLYIIVGTFPVLFIGEAMRAIKKLVKN